MIKTHPSKLKSKWTSMYMVTKVYGNGSIEIEDVKGVKFKHNGQRLKVYFEEGRVVKFIEVVYLDDV